MLSNSVSTKQLKLQFTSECTKYFYSSPPVCVVLNGLRMPINNADAVVYLNVVVYWPSFNAMCVVCPYEHTLLALKLKVSKRYYNTLIIFAVFKLIKL